jgi:hypothetical protein
VESIAVNVVVALITASLTYFLTDYLRQSGKLIVNVGWIDFTRNEDGLVEVEFGMDMYNSSDIAKALRQLVVEFNIKERKKRSTWSSFNLFTSLESPIKVGKRKIGWDGLGSITIQPRELKYFNLKFYVDKEFLDTLKGENKLYLVASYPNGKKFIGFLTTTNFDER